MREALRAAFGRWLDGRGYELKVKTKPLRRPPEFLAAARAAGFRPGTIVDVGVGPGTPWLMDAFPEAHLVLVEPNPGFRPAIERILAARKGEVHWVAAAGAPGETVLHVNPVSPTSSTIHAVAPEHAAEMARRGEAVATEALPVRLARLDDLGHAGWPGPFLLKLDCEGFELEALKGAAALLRGTDMVIAETSVAPRHAGGYAFAEAIAAFDALGFALFDIVDMQQYGANGRLSVIDAVFLPKGRLLDLR
jgi:FkbM family methyltransferase